MLVKSRRKALSLAMAVGMLALAGSASAQPVDPVEAAITRISTERAALQAAGNLNAETNAALLASAFADVDPAALTAAQIQRIISQNLLSQATGKSDAIISRLDVLSASTDESGAQAASLRVMALGRMSPNARGTSEDIAKILRIALVHPGLESAIRSGTAAPLMSGIGMLNDKGAFALCAEEVFELGESLSTEASPKVLMGINTLVQGLRGAEMDAGRVEALRGHLVEVAAAALERGRADSAYLAAADMKRLQRQHDLLDGAWGRGQLIGYESPAMSFDWSTDPKVTSLEDLRGSVVIVDFWATWCGPCRGSFPNVAELAARYEGFPVRIIGVTSLQGYHISSDQDERLRVDCAGDAQKEYGLMPEFMSEMGMTWDVMFTPTDVFNPQYGVNGIPHVAIIAPDGTVRHNGLHPANPLAEKAKLIDSILAEFNLPHPEALPEEEPAAEEQGG